jgi:hypothetical protein
MIDKKLSFYGNFDELARIIEEYGLDNGPQDAIADAVEGTEVATINSILEVLRARNIIASA